METIIKNAIEEYQCPGCVAGSDISCFKKNNDGVGCGGHVAGTMMTGGVGTFFLGLPTGFNRLGFDTSLKPTIYKSFAENTEWQYDKYNVPVWKHVNKSGHTIVRGMMPRRNLTFIHLYLENCSDKINCLELTKEDLDEMD